MTMPNPTGALLVAGGAADPNLTRLIDVAVGLGVPVADARHHAKESPAFFWAMGPNLGSTPESGVQNESPTIAGQPLSPSGAFIRYDVFSGLSATGQPTANPDVSQRAAGWYQTVYGWLLSQPSIGLFNRHALPIAGNKPATLVLAQQLGLPIPKTLITNEERRINQLGTQGFVAKPTAGGDFCYSLEKLLATVQFVQGSAATPAIVQTRLSAPEVRIYIIGQQAFAFEMRSESLDYRVKQDAEVIPLATVPPEAGQLKVLMNKLQMTFGAADFKSDPHTGELVFLELNSSPMFVRFDLTVKGALCAAMVRELVGDSSNQDSSTDSF